jgi:hypothetical protein
MANCHAARVLIRLPGMPTGRFNTLAACRLPLGVKRYLFFIGSEPILFRAYLIQTYLIPPI